MKDIFSRAKKADTAACIPKLSTLSFIYNQVLIFTAWRGIE